jgi:hypothetical protein
MPSGHEVYRARLEALADRTVLTVSLDAWCERTGVGGVGDGWRQDYGRFYPGQDPWAVLVFEAGPLVLRVAVHEEPAADRVAVDGVGHVRISGFEEDRELPGLPAVLAALVDVRVVRYRPGKRCTLAGSVDGERRFAKVVPDPSPLHRDAVELWRAGGRDELAFAVAEPLVMEARWVRCGRAWCPALRCLPSCRVRAVRSWRDVSARRWRVSREARLSPRRSRVQECNWPALSERSRE